ncbi:MAG: response regulator transcription factor [Chloroflexi bacterium]|nr:response regulator transcription factor [Chloroflexota bacterium]
MGAIRIAIADDQTLIREGLAALLALDSGLEIVGTAADGRQAVALVAEQAPDVMLMDIRMPVMNGVAATREINARYPHTRVIVLTTFDDDEYVFASLQAGACGYLLKNAEREHLAAAIRAVHAGEAILDPAVTQKVIRRATRPGMEQALCERLTRREREVLHGMAAGASNAEIAAQLCLAEGTVKNHVSHILDKLGAHNRAHAIHLAAEWGLLLDDGN